MRIVLIIFLTIIGAWLIREYGDSRYLDGANTAFDMAAQILKNAKERMTNHETAEQAFINAEKDIANGINSSSWSGLRSNGGSGNTQNSETPGGTKRDR